MDSFEYFQKSYVDQRILIIDDDLGYLAAMGAMLQSLGAQVEIADNGWYGIQKVRQSNFDAVILDWQMPELNGWKVLYFLERWALSEGTRVDQIPRIVVCTGVFAEKLSLPFSNLTSVREIWQKSDGWSALRVQSQRLIDDIRQGG